MYSAVNSILVTLISKANLEKTIKQYRPISFCTTIYKTISKNMTYKLGGVLKSIIHQSQAAFVRGQHIQDHILLAYELIKDYTVKGWMLRCMLQMDLQKAYDTIDWRELWRTS